MHRAQSARFFGPSSTNRSANSTPQNDLPSNSTLTRTSTTLHSNNRPALQREHSNQNHSHHLNQSNLTSPTSEHHNNNSSTTTPPSLQHQNSGSGTFGNENISLSLTVSPSRQQLRAKKLDEFSVASQQSLQYFSSLQDLFNEASQLKHNYFLNQIYEIAFVGVLSKANGGSEVMGAKVSREFNNFVKEKETQDALRMGQEAIALLNGGGSFSANGSIASSSSQSNNNFNFNNINPAIKEFQQQAEFWKSVAQTTHKHNAMLLEAKKMLEGSAKRSSELQLRVDSLMEQVSSLERKNENEIANSKKIAAERQSYIEQLGTVSGQIQKIQKKLDIHERQAVLYKKEKEKDQHSQAEKDKQIMTLSSQLRQASAAVEMLTASFNNEREAHHHVRHLYERIVNHRKTDGCQTDISGPALMTEELMWNFTESRLTCLFEASQTALFGAIEEATRQRKNAQIYESYAQEALDNVDEQSKIQSNKDLSWAEQLRQVKLEAEAECRRADEQRKKTAELLHENEILKNQVKELERKYEEQYNLELKMKKGLLKSVSVQSDASFDPKTGSKRAYNAVSMSSQTSEGWYSMLKLEASHRISEEMRREKLSKMTTKDEEDGKDDDVEGEAETSGAIGQKLKRTNSATGVPVLLLTNSAVAADNMRSSTLLSGQKAKDSVAIARQNVRRILSGGTSASATQQMQRKELLGVIRALSEAITLSAAHIKDLEGEIERIVADVFDSKPSTDQCVSAQEDSRGNLIIDGGKVFSISNVKVKKDNSEGTTTTTTAKPVKNNNMNFDFGFSQTNQALSPIRTNDEASFSFANSAAMRPELVSHHMTLMNVNNRQESTNFNNNNNNENHDFSYYNSSNSFGDSKNRKTQLEQLVARGDSINSNGGRKSNSNSNSNSQNVLSRIEAVQRQTQMILEESSPLALKRQKNSEPSTPLQQQNQNHQGSTSKKTTSFLIPSSNEFDRHQNAHDDHDDNNDYENDQHHFNEQNFSLSSPNNNNNNNNQQQQQNQKSHNWLVNHGSKKANSPNSTSASGWSSSTSTRQPTSLKLKKQAQVQELRQKYKQFGNNNSTSRDNSRSSSVNSNGSAFLSEEELRRRIYQEENNERNNASEYERRLHHIEDPEANPYAREFYESDGTFAGAQSLPGDSNHHLVGGESSVLGFPYNRLLLSQQQQRSVSSPKSKLQTKRDIQNNSSSPQKLTASSTNQQQQQAKSNTTAFSPSRFHFG